MEGKISSLLETEYGIRVNEIESFRNLWRVHSDEGQFVVKAYPKGVPLVEWQGYLFQELRKKGFAHFCPFLMNHNEKVWFGDESNPMVLMPFLEGKIARYSNFEDIDKVIELLASFHHHGAWIGIDVLPKYREVRTYRLFKRLQEFEELYYKIGVKKKRDALDEEILSLGGFMIDFGRQAFQWIDQQKMNQLHQDAIDYRFISHRDVANHNFLLGEKSWIIDFDLSAFEAQVMDLWQLMNRIMVDWEWDLDQFFQVESAYHQLRKLSDNERILLRQLSLFPNEFFRETIGAYYRPDKYKREHVLPYIQRFHDEFEAYELFRRKVIQG